MITVGARTYSTVTALLRLIVEATALGRQRKEVCSHRRPQLFALLWLFIASVSVHDAALVVLNREAIMDFEQNPLGRWLIELGAGSVWLFVAVKLLGTCVVCGLLASIHEVSRAMGLAVAAPLACFQLGLLAYLYTY